jgi:hypothetical protein
MEGASSARAELTSVRRDAFAAAERSNTLLASQAFERDPDLLFGGELAADVADGLLGRVFLGHGFFLLSESRTLS